MGQKQITRCSVIGITVVTLLLSGCALVPGLPGITPELPSVEEQERQEAEESAEEPLATGLVECTPDQRGGMERTIRAQTEAFSDGDYAEAYAYASESFQSSVPLLAFEQIIRGSYGPLVISAELRFGECLADAKQGTGTIDARFSNNGTEVVGLKYVMVEESAGWRVDGASNLTVVGQGS